ncbi:hypothetical protein [Variovorax sp. ZT5P30]
MEIPILTRNENYKYLPVVATFRWLPGESVNDWVMPNGRPRSDRELAAEILISIRRVQEAGSSSPSRKLSVSHVLELDRAAALVVSTFLSALPRLGEPALDTRQQRFAEGEREFSLRPLSYGVQEIWPWNSKSTRVT